MEAMSLEVALLQDAHDLSELENMARDYFEVNASFAGVVEAEVVMVSTASDYAHQTLGERLLFFSGLYAMENASTDAAIVHEITGFGELMTIVPTPFLEQLPAHTPSSWSTSEATWYQNGLGLVVEPLLPEIFDGQPESLSSLHGIAGLYDQLVLPLNNNLVSITSMPLCLEES